MKTTVPHVVMDHSDRPITKFGQDIAATFPSILPIDKIPANRDRQKPHTFWIVFKLRTSLTLSAIRNDELVSTVLRQTIGRLTFHPWPPSDRDVVSVGFVIGAIPKY
jgi:hypothetical protein